MANQRKKGVQRITLTLPDELLARIEAAASKRGIDRLAFVRELLASHVERLERMLEGQDSAGRN